MDSTSRAGKDTSLAVKSPPSPQLLAMKSSYQRCLPGRAQCEDHTKPVAGSRRERSAVATCFVNPLACAQCHRRKAKCGGQRPTCDRCSRNGTDCYYDAEEGETRSSTLKKRCLVLSEEIEVLRAEVNQLKGLYEYMQAASDEEAYRVLREIRSCVEIEGNQLRPFEQGEDLKASIRYRTAPKAVVDALDIRPVDAFAIQVPALPWTTTAGDEVVSELISQYFTFDHLYVFPPIARSTFVDEMRKGDPTVATCCSALLVNAICAQQSFLSLRRHLGPLIRRDVADSFLEEANTLLQAGSGCISLTTCQAISLMYAAVAARNHLAATPEA
ncbi:Zn(2)-C6 fungal-type DNA-binding domain protein [Metarhizium rileyi]|uniref:Zn(2)-C6 fungal-type DNA-binding domain protein n=1 Tax=Metarhizium rileyi (strain RCEF 4871) TaxID=1649241 RepID=A0A162HZK4_METRR|nr:Zn(2)-C6 fungal-type DNA-binding domain protein [Metarhizium rileyi RCEF 4871]